MAVYFAYGTLLDVEEMQGLCPNAIPVGVMRLEGFELVFVTCSDGKTGGCSLVASPENTLFGLQWQLPDDELDALDAAAGVSAGLWEHQPISVLDAADNPVNTITYRIPNDTGQFVPSDDYVRPIIDGSRKLNLPLEYRDRLIQIIQQAQVKQ